MPPLPDTNAAESILPPARPPIAQDIFCQNCGYNLRTLTSDRCPECGRSLEGLRDTVSHIPWAHRKELGRFQAYWKTVWFVMFQQKKFCEEMARPVSYADSQRFRTMTILFVFVSIVASTVAAYIFYPPGSAQNATFSFTTFGPTTGSSLPELAYADIWPIAILCLCCLLYLFAATGAPSYFFQPRSMTTEMQNRAIALSYYACAPLSLVFVLMLFIPSLVPLIEFMCDTVGGAMFPRLSLSTDDQVAIVAILLGAVILIWWIQLVRVGWRVMRNLKRRALIIAICVPLLWLILGFLCFVVLPFVLLSVIVAVASLR
jgi:hypothetical protein